MDTAVREAKRAFKAQRWHRCGRGVNAAAGEAAQTGTGRGAITRAIRRGALAFRPPHVLHGRLRARKKTERIYTVRAEYVKSKR